MNSRLSTGIAIGLAGLGIYKLVQELWFQPSAVPPFDAESPAATAAVEDEFLMLAGGMQPISQQDAERISRQLDRLGSDNRQYPLFLHTIGGYFGPAMAIALAVRRRGRINAVVPYYAQSAGTLIALACESIIMPPHATLGPVDPQIGGLSAASLLELTESKPVTAVSDEYLMLSMEAKRVLQFTIEFLRPLVPQKALERLVSGSVPHSSPITRDEAEALGLPIVKTESVDATYALVERMGT